MKPVLMLFVLAFTSQAFAIHAYRTQECSNGRLEFRYTGNYPIGGMYEINAVGVDREREDAPVFKGYAADEAGPGEGPRNSRDAAPLEEGEAFSFITLDSQTIGTPVETSEDYFDHTEWKSVVKIKLLRLTATVRATLGVVEDQEIVLQCEETTDVPNGRPQDEE